MLALQIVTNTKFWSFIFCIQEKKTNFFIIFNSSTLKDFVPKYYIKTLQEEVVLCEKKQ